MRTLRSSLGFFGVFAILGVARPAAAQAVGDEFQINTYTTSQQDILFGNGRAVAIDPSGNFVVVWYSAGSSGSDFDGSVQGQRFDFSGHPLGGEFQVNTSTMGTQRSASVAMAADGSFVVAWNSISIAPGTSGYEIEARRFDSSGSPIGDDFQVNTYTTEQQMRPSVAVEASGGFVVAWDGFGSSGTDSSPYSIQARRFDASGSPIGADFQVNTYTSSVQTSSSISALPSGGFIIAWASFGSAETDSSTYSIQARRFDSAGNPIGGDFQVNGYTTDAQRYPSIAADATGGFLVVWGSRASPGTDTSADSIQARRFDASGNPIGDDFQVNTYTAFAQNLPSVAVNDGGFVVGWESYGSVGSDSSSFSIQARRFDASGSPIGDEFQVNTFTTDVQAAPSLAAGPEGGLVVAWMSYMQDGSNFGIFGRRLAFLPTLSVDDVVVSEGDGTAAFTVSLSFASTSTVTVKYKTGDGSAMAASDYTAKPLTKLTFAPGETSKPVVITVNPDDRDENDLEDFAVNLSAPTNAEIADGQGIGTIEDDDPVPSLSIGDASVTEGDAGTQTMTFTATLTPASGRAVTVSYATANQSASAPSDYRAKSGTLSFNAGQTSKTLSVTIKGDTANEPDETFNLNLANETNATLGDAQGVGTILNNDSLVGAPSLSITDVSVTEPDSGMTDATFTVSLSGPATQTVTVHYATANGTAMAGATKDFVTKSGTLTFPVGGGLSQNVTVKVNGDLVDEADETFFVNLSSPAQATILDGQGLGTIQDNDPLPALSIGDASLTEGDSGTQNMIFTLTLSPASGRKVTVHYATSGAGSATAPADYTAKSGTLSFTAGQASKTISVPIKGDLLAEGDEIFHVDLDTPTNATLADGHAVGTIGDNEVAAHTCGDGAGPGGIDIHCACGNTVVTSTTLDLGLDTVTNTACGGNGLSLADGVTLDLNGLTVSGDSGSGTGISGNGVATLTNGTVADFGGSGIVVPPGASLTVTDTAVLRSAGYGLEAWGQLDATNVEVGWSALHGVFVDSPDPVTLTGANVHDSGNHPAGAIAGQSGVYARRASDADGLVVQGFGGQIHVNSGHGVVLGHLTEQTGAVNGLIGDAQIFGNQLGGIRVQEKDLVSARTASAILANNIYDNGGPGIYVSTSFQKPVGAVDRRTISSNDIHHNAVVGGCTVATGDQAASQVVFDGPIGDADPTVSNATDPPGPDPEYAADFRCYWGVDESERNDTLAECVAMSNPNATESGGVNNHCLWNGTQCRIAWDMAGREGVEACDSSRNRIFAYVNDQNEDPFTQRGVAAINGAYVKARRDIWGSGGATNGIFEEASSDSRIDPNDDCGSVSTCP